MPGCAAIGCNNRSEKGYMMKCFPRDPILRQIWKERVGRSEWEPSNNSFLCHTHFESNQWIVTHNGRVKLKKGALPTVFMVTSTRKSSKKRGISESDNGENGDDYLIEYLQNDCPSSIESSQSETLVSAITAQDSLQSMSSDNIYMVQNQNIVIEKLLTEGNYMIVKYQKEDDLDNPNVNYFKTEIKNEMEDKLLNDEYMQIEKRLKLVCDGEKYDDLINKRETLSEGFANSEVDDYKNRIPKQDSNENLVEKVDVSSTNEISYDILDKNSKFIIKISGVPEDIYEITKNLNACVNRTKPAFLDQNSTKFVTSEIEVNFKEINDKVNMKDVREDQNSTQSDEASNMRQDSVPRDFMFVNELLHKYKDLEAKVGIQQQIISMLSEQSIEHKDIADSMKLMEAELKRKDTEIDQLRGNVIIKKNSSIHKKLNNKVDTQTEVDQPLLFKITNRMNQLEATNKQLMKSLNSEVEKRRKAEYQVKDRESKIKELNWKLDKASKFYERSVRNTNTYRRKLSILQTLLRRKNIIDDKKQTYDELTSESTRGSFSKRSLTAALSILKSCGHRGYTKLLAYNFPLPSINILLNKGNYTLEDTNRDKVLDKVKTNDNKNSASELASGTVQDIFNESSDGDYTMDINEFKKYVLTDDNPS